MPKPMVCPDCGTKLRTLDGWLWHVKLCPNKPKEDRK